MREHLARALLTLTTAAAVAGCEFREDRTMASCDVVAHGVLVEAEESRVVHAPTAPGEELLRYDGIQIAENTDRIPIGSGTRFGFQTEYRNLSDDAQIRLEVSHPPMVSPDGRTLEGYTLDHAPGNGFSYGFDNEWEEVEGQWHFRIFLEDRLLCEQGFMTYRPETGDGEG